MVFLKLLNEIKKKENFKRPIHILKEPRGLGDMKSDNTEFFF